MKRLVFICAALLCLSLSNIIKGEEVSSDAANEFEFSEDNREYFSYELSLPEPIVQPTEVQSEQIIQTTKTSIKTEPYPYGVWRVTAHFPSPVEAEYTTSDRVLCLNVNQKIDTDDLDKANEKLSYLLKEVNNGYRTLYFEAKCPAFYCVYTYENTLVVDIIPNYSASCASVRSLELARASLLVEDRIYEQAYDYLDELLVRYPCDKDLLVEYAVLEGHVPRWQHSLHILEDLHARFPQDGEISKLLHDTFYPHSSYVAFSREAELTLHQSAEQFYEVSAEWLADATLWNFLYVGGTAQAVNAHIVAYGIQLSDGNASGFLGTRYQGSLYVRNELLDGNFYTATLYAGEGIVPGAGVAATWLWPAVQGTFGLTFDWHKPYWDIYETLLYFGREDKGEFTVTSVYNRFWSGNLTAGAHRVGLNYVVNGFTSIIIDGEVDWKWMVPNPEVGITYAFEAEYIRTIAERIASDGTLFQPIPYSSYAYNTLQAFINYNWRNRWQWNLFGGGVFNSLGTNDYTWGISLDYQNPCPYTWELDLSVSRYPDPQVGGTPTVYLSATITARF